MSRTSRSSSVKALSKTKHQVEHSNIPFPEWQDSDINNEKWDVFVKKERRKSVSSRKSITSKKSTESLTYMEPSFFVDNQDVVLPRTVQAYDWRRPDQIFKNVAFVVSKSNIDFLALRNGSKHILHSEFMRTFLSSVGILEYVSVTRPWQIESVNSGYVPNTEGMDWKPWHHIYSLCGAGKGHPHNPKYNPSGKYVIRLHWLGCWRKIYVDDLLPVDENNNILLPGYQLIIQEEEQELTVQKSVTSSQSKKSKVSKKSKSSEKSSKGSAKKKAATKKEVPEVELWPYLLCKALLKIAALTWTQQKEVVDFSPITCFTGWILQKIDTTQVDTDDVWKICVAYLPKFQWTEDGRSQSKGTKADKSNKKDKETGSKSSKGSKKDKTSKKSKTSEKGDVQEVIDETKVYCLVGSSNSIRNFIKDLNSEDIPNEWTQEFLIEQSRDIPLIKPEPRPELARWKRFRWLKWAISKGLWPADDLSTPIRCLKIYNDLKQDDARPETKKPSSEKNNTNKSSKSKGSKKSSKSSKGGALKIFPLVDKSVWVDFADVEEHVNTLFIFFRPSQFTSFVKISDSIKCNQRYEMQAHGKEKSKKSEVVVNTCQELKWSLDLKESRNQPLCLIMDGLDQKLLIINLCQIGHLDRIVMARNSTDEPPFASVVLEKFNWQLNRVGKIRTFLTTAGSKSVLLYLCPGRVTYKLWIWSNTNYFVSLLSNTPITVAVFDEIINYMGVESILLGRLTQEVGVAFGNLVKAFGTQDYLEEMRKFNKSFRPDVSLSKVKSKELLDEFMILLLRYLNNKEETFALKVLFIDPGICNERSHTLFQLSRDTFSTFTSIPDVTSENVYEVKLQERAAVIIQSAFKTLYVKKLLEMHKQSNNKYYPVYEKLKQIYYTIFSDTKRNICMKMLKEFYLNNDVLKNSRLYNDLYNAIESKSYKGNVAAQANSWVFITRQKFINKSFKPRMMRPVLFVNLPKYMIRIFDNDTLHEVKRYTNNVETYLYPPNQKGFTILCYGWAKESTKVSWKLDLTHLKLNTPSFLIAEENLDVKVLNERYNPNIYARVFKCQLEIYQLADLTVRLSTSGASAELELAVRDSSNKTLAKIHGKQNVILPLIRLKSPTSDQMEDEFRMSEIHRLSGSSGKVVGKQRPVKEKNISVTSLSSNTYYIEATVLNNTWPLTMREWLNVKMERTKYLLYPSTVDILTKFPTKKCAMIETKNESPFWMLEVIHNVGEYLTIKRDLTRQNEIDSIKRSWYEADPNRHEKSRKIREEYLEELYLKSRKMSNFDTTTSQTNIFDVPLYRWIPETAMAPPFDLSDYYCEFEDNQSYPKTEELENLLVHKSMEEVIALHNTLSQCRERMDKLGTDQIENFVIMNEWYKGCREDSAELIKSAYAMRDKFIDMLINANNPAGTKESSKGKESKKKKKK